MAERTGDSKSFNVNAIADKNLTVAIKTAELRDERASRLRQEEAEKAH